MKLRLYHTWLIITSGLLLTFSFVGCTAEPEVQSPPNIVLIMADDVDFTNFSCYGGSIPTPGIDQLAAEGMRFQNVHTTASACTPSRFSVITGLYPGRCQDPDFLEGQPLDQPYTITWNTPITPANTTLHEVLQPDYFTGYVGKFHIGGLHEDTPEANPDIPLIPETLDLNTEEADRLLMQYQKVLQEQVRALTGADYAASILWENSEELPHPGIRHHHLEWMLNGGLEFLEATSRQEQPFFLHFNTTALHGPNHYEDLKRDARFSPEGRLDLSNHPMPERSSYFQQLETLGLPHGAGVPDHINHYNIGTLYLDAQIKALLQVLEGKGLKDNTLIILTADHNLEPGKSTVYEKGLRVPFLVRWPGKVEAGTTNDDLISFVDLLPTLAGIAKTDNNLPRTDGVDWSGALFEGKASPKRTHLYFEEGYTRAVTDGRWKYIAMRFPDTLIAQLESGVQTGITHLGQPIHAFGYIAQEYHPGYFHADQLYDLEADPYEQRNLASLPTYADTLASLRAVLAEHAATFDHAFPIQDTSYAKRPAYQAAAAAVKARGSGFIPWWKRELEYPPVKH
ncbi:MAG: sulfatase-like hydrolase/transferase [Phaeodactylibacter sp.]|uniref:sulfatase family protein n=1 Tax=Phaeodactylibacter sp. TaxID=1940289 RepID=UPI0032EAF06D